MEVSGQLHAPAPLPPGKNSGTHWTGSRLAPRDGLDVLEKGRNSYCVSRFEHRNNKAVTWSLRRLRKHGSPSRAVCMGCTFLMTTRLNCGTVRNLVLLSGGTRRSKDIQLRH